MAGKGPSEECGCLLRLGAEGEAGRERWVQGWGGLLTGSGEKELKGGEKEGRLLLFS